MFDKLKSRLHSLLLWGEKEIKLGGVGVFFCDTTVTVGVYAEDGSPSYGVCVEPFRLHLIGKDGDIHLCSPGFSLTDWLLRT